jgi:hypothetical protein
MPTKEIDEQKDLDFTLLKLFIEINDEFAIIDLLENFNNLNENETINYFNNFNVN